MQHFITFAQKNAGQLPSVKEMEVLITSVQQDRNFGYAEGMADVLSVIPACSKSTAFQALKAARAVAANVSKGTPVPEELAAFLKRILEEEGK